MRTQSQSEILSTGDIFELVPDLDREFLMVDEKIAYIVLGFRDACMEVAELGGQNRDSRIVMARDIPAPGEFTKWRFTQSLTTLRDHYTSAVLAVLRESMDDLRTVEGIEGASLRLENVDTQKTGKGDFSAYVRLKNGLFSQASYNFGGKQPVRPVLRGVDPVELGVIPEHLIIRRDEEVSFDPGINDLTLGEQDAAAIKAMAQERGLLMYPESYIGGRIIRQGHNDNALVRIEAYLASDTPDTPAEFPDVKSAHEAVVAILKVIQISKPRTNSVPTTKPLARL